MESNKIESIFESYLYKENTNYALLINGKWGSGKTFLWKNVLEKKAIEKEFEPIYISLNGINDVREIEGMLLSKALKLDNVYLKNSLKFLRNGINVVGNIIGGGSQLSDVSKGINLNLYLSNMVLCFDDLERCSLPIKEILGLINDYTEHKNIKVIICADELEIEHKETYHKIKEKLIGRTLSYTANYDELFSSYIENTNDEEFGVFLNKNKKVIIRFFKKHDIQNLRTFGFFLENINLLYGHYKTEDEKTIDSMLFFTAIISNEFKKGELKFSNLKDRQGIDGYYLFFDHEESVNNMIGIPNIKTKEKEVKEKSYKEQFKDKYLSNQNEKDMYLFSNSVYEFILSGYLDTEKLKNELDIQNGKNNDTEEQKAYNNLIGYNFRILENDELDASLKKVLEFAELGKYNMYSYQTMYANFLYHIEIGSLDLTDKELVSLLTKGLNLSKNISDINNSQMGNIQHFAEEKGLSDIEKEILKLHNEKHNKQKNELANGIFEILDQELVEINEFFTDVTSSAYCLFEFVDAKRLFDKLINLRNKNILFFSDALKNNYKKHYFEFPEKELPFFETLQELLKEHSNSNELKNPKKIILKELSDRIEEIIKRFKERIEQKNL
jgi:hypothetical protein